jgi:hypothetical protein
MLFFFPVKRVAPGGTRKGLMLRLFTGEHHERCPAPASPPPKPRTHSRH